MSQSEYPDLNWEEEIRRRQEVFLNSALGVGAVVGSEFIPPLQATEGINKGLIIGGTLIAFKGLLARFRANQNLRLIDYAETWTDDESLG